MLALARKNKIRELISEKKNVTVSELAELFAVTEETIRRDLKSLEELGVLQRTYGGAFIQDGVNSDIRTSLRETILIPNKQRIAKKCAAFINNGDTITLDASTTALHICDEIKNKRLTVLTDSLKIANYLAEFENIQLISTGGTFNSTYASFVGKSARQTIREHFVDKAFVSCRSLDKEHGITEACEELAANRKLLMERANQVYLIADHSKFDRVSFVNICGFDQIDALIVDKILCPEWHDFLEQNDVMLYECE
ncbi:MAG: DeoR/GlpR family DNA-binding transcription regulator [Christensenellaceae bacterium]